MKETDTFTIVINKFPIFVIANGIFVISMFNLNIISYEKEFFIRSNDCNGCNQCRRSVYSDGKVGVGTPASDSLKSTLTVIGSSDWNGVKVQSNGRGIYAET